MLLQELHINIKWPANIHCDNVGSIQIATNPGVNPGVITFQKIQRKT